MTSWAYLSTDGEIAHIFPRRDDRQHTFGDEPCWCGHSLARDNLGRAIVVHTSSDGTQDLDAGIRKIPNRLEAQNGSNYR